MTSLVCLRRPSRLRHSQSCRLLLLWTFLWSGLFPASPSEFEPDDDDDDENDDDDDDEEDEDEEEEEEQRIQVLLLMMMI